MKLIKWGIIGCGDVTEVKSGPAFNKIPGSSLVAVMRRNAAKAEDYAKRHGVPRWYNDADALLNDPGVNAIYVATPPSSHESYAQAALQLGKPVYVEKPFTLDAAGARRLQDAAERTGIPLVVAHYRREQSKFKTIRDIIKNGEIGDIRHVQLELYQPPLTASDLQNPFHAWRVDPSIAGGGLFHDLAPHQLDLMLYFFGPVASISGLSHSQSNLYSAPDITTGFILFQSGVVFSGTWCFSTAASSKRDNCVITGSAGSIRFSIFDQSPVYLTRAGMEEQLVFDQLAHVQQPMIAATVKYFQGEGENPCTASDAVQVMAMIDAFSGK